MGPTNVTELENWDQMKIEVRVGERSVQSKLGINHRDFFFGWWGREG